MGKIKIGIIGLGIMGQAHANTVGEISNCTLAAVCDENNESLEKFTIAGNPAKFSSPDKFFREADVDAIIIAAPHPFHHTLAVKAMEYGKHVLVEKTSCHA